MGSESEYLTIPIIFGLNFLLTLADSDLAKGGYCFFFACPAGFSSFCDFFLFYPK